NQPLRVDVLGYGLPLRSVARVESAAFPRVSPHSAGVLGSRVLLSFLVTWSRSAWRPGLLLRLLHLRRLVFVLVIRAVATFCSRKRGTEDWQRGRQRCRGRPDRERDQGRERQQRRLCAVPPLEHAVQSVPRPASHSLHSRPHENT